MSFSLWKVSSVFIFQRVCLDSNCFQSNYVVSNGFIVTHLDNWPLLVEKYIHDNVSNSSNMKCNTKGSMTMTMTMTLGYLFKLLQKGPAFGCSFRAQPEDWFCTWIVYNLFILSKKCERIGQMNHEIKICFNIHPYWSCYWSFDHFAWWLKLHKVAILTI